MTEFNTATSTVGAGQQPASVTPPSGWQGTQQPPAATPPTEAGAQGTESSAPTIEWDKIDWDAHADNVPWDKIGVKRIEKIPGVAKMQSTFQRQIAERERRYQAESEALRHQLQQYQQIISGQYPEMADQLKNIQQQGDFVRMQTELERYHEMEARKAIAERYGVPEETVFGFAGGPEEVERQAFEYQRGHLTQERQTLQQQMADLQRQLDAMKRQNTDPAANADMGQSAPAGNYYQTNYENLIRDGRGPEAERLLRDARQKGVQIDTTRLKPSHWG